MAQLKTKLQIIISLAFLLFVFTGLFIFFFSRNSSNSLSLNSLKPSLSSAPIPETITYSAWIPYWDEARALKSIQQATGKLDLILPLWYQLNQSAKLEVFPTNQKQAIIDLANQNSIALMPTLGNELDGQRVSLLLSDSKLQRNLINSLVTTALENHFIGWDLDLEQVPAKDRDKFSSFVADTSRALKSNNLLLSVTLHAQTGSSKDWAGSKGQDYKALAQSPDFVRVMAYDFHHATSNPGPLTPLDYLQKVINYATKTIPINKLVLALPTYGYDWGPDIGEPLQYADTINRLKQFNLKPARDKKSQALTTSYSQDNQAHTVWFEDTHSLGVKLDLAKKKGIHQFTLWHLGGEDPSIWDNLQPSP